MIQILLVVPIGCDKKDLADLYSWLELLVKTGSNLLTAGVEKVLSLLLVVLSALVTEGTH